METTIAPIADVRVASFLAWIEKRGGFSQEDKEHLARIAEEFRRGWTEGRPAREVATGKGGPTP